MKIVYIVNARIPTEKAHGYQICKMCEEFSNVGLEVKLLVPTRINPVKGNAFSFYGLEKNFKINYIKSFDFLKFEKYLGRYSFYIQSLLFLAKLLFRSIDKNTLIYTRNPELVWLFKLKGFKVVYECHDWFNKKKKIALFFLRKCDWIITTNNYTKKEFIKNGFKDNNVLVASNGVNVELFSIDVKKNDAIKKLKPRQEIKNKLLNSKVLVYTGNFKTKDIDKGIKEILQAIKILDIEKLYFVAVGGSIKDIEYYKDLAKQLNIHNRTCFLSRQTHKELALFQKVADILLMPFPRKAHYEYFMTPIKMFEYMASKRPIIASNLPSIREILNDKNCLFCRPGNFKDLADKIRLLLSNKKLANQISNQAHKDVQKYTWQKRTEKILNFIKN